MKKIKFALVAVALMVASMASAQVSLGIRGGLNMSNFSGKDAKFLSVNPSMLIGGHVGLTADYEFMSGMSIQSGLYFTTKGAKYSEIVVGQTGTITYRPMYLQVPIHFAYKIPIASGTRFVLHAGPYLAYGVGGKVTASAKGLIDGSSDTGDVFGDNGAFDNRFDAGLGLGADFEVNRLVFGLGWDMGLVNVVHKDLDIKTQNAYLSVGYMF